MTIRIHPIPAFNDNYIWCLHDDEHAWVVDPGCADSVLNYLTEQQLQLAGVLITHHHPDHTGGIAKLAASGVDLPVVGPKSDKINGLSLTVADNDTLILAQLGIVMTVMSLPGHTLDHIGFYNDDMVFCGDTLFSGGCGRLFEGTAAQLQHSLQRLANLPTTTAVYCTHEYTCANLRFAVMVEPDNQALLQYQRQCLLKRQQQQPTLPTTIATERAINPFLRCDQATILNSLEQHSQLSLTDNVSRFAALRQWKDNA
ncbi:hydroxyacylglutathione hydrolase [uncultured Ferrimonas sp.]|uniref:hydroxyacylglutathione hydrolase n=1 Tax=uncultured Ferrimonas sp. TaxID=432640 RepID=UPI0026197B92|nr:hydroxyacylglutathione hydrolase [uncultured Ferrimonas sp.]